MSRPRDVPEDEEIDEDMDEEMDEGMDMFEALGTLLATEDGETIATSVQNLATSAEKIAMSLEMQNKILVKILSAVNKPAAQACACKAPEPAST